MSGRGVVDFDGLGEYIAEKVSARVLEQIVEKVLAAFDARTNDKLLSTADVARLLGIDRKALQERFRRAAKRGQPHELEATALEVDGVRCWRRSDVERFIARIAGQVSR